MLTSAVRTAEFSAAGRRGSMRANDGWQRGCLQVYTGDGKGKTTAAFGLALRAAGHGLRVYVGQFMKGYPYGELAAAAALGGGIEVEQFGTRECIPWRAEPDPADAARARDGLERCFAAMRSGRYEVIVLDEATTAVHFQLIPLGALLDFADAKPPGIELVCTGRWAPQELIARADLVTEMREVKHPYASSGLAARDGIER
jgi:cob(I)alamin adenosyltransferase